MSGLMPRARRSAARLSARGPKAAIRKALKKGDSGIRKIAPIFGVGTGTVQRIKAEMSAAV